MGGDERRASDWERGHLARETNALDCAYGFRGQDARAPSKEPRAFQSQSCIRVQSALNQYAAEAFAREAKRTGRPQDNK